MIFGDKSILKPCPFCGGDARFKKISYNNYTQFIGWDYTIECSKCGVRFPQKATLSIYMNEDGLPSISSASEGNRNVLIDAWNKRKGDN